MNHEGKDHSLVSLKPHTKALLGGYIENTKQAPLEPEYLTEGNIN